MNYKTFMKLVEDLDKDKYHTCCDITDFNGDCHWVIFRKDMSWEEYWSSNNRPILDSKINTDEDLIKFVAKECIK